MAKYASEVIKQAQAWVGCKESNGTHKKIIDVYNSHQPLARGYKVKYTDAWCATFVSAVAIKLGYTDIIPTECGCPQMIDLLKNKGIWVENESVTPAPGWLLLYDWEDNGKGDNKGAPNHIGIVEKVSGGNVTIIEGNYNNAVKRRTLKINGKYMRGYGAPKYDTVPVKTITDIAKEVINGKWGNGVVRQAKLKAAGYDYKKVQEEVNRLLKPAPAKKNIDTIAKEVLNGKWGNGEDRKKRLTAAGYDYKAVQKRVNELSK